MGQGAQYYYRGAPLFRLGSSQLWNQSDSGLATVVEISQRWKAVNSIYIARITKMQSHLFQSLSSRKGHFMFLKPDEIS
jgi:hypothetical protein